MKKLIISSLLLLSTVSLSASTTMCFKENHTSMSTIEDTKLDGGECKSAHTLKDMKNDGWSVEDIKITTNDGKYNFIYILKKGSSSNSSSFVANNENLSEQELEDKIIKKLEAKKKREEKEKELERKVKAKQKGEELYTKKCASCHGQKGEKKAYAVAQPLNSMSLEDMKDAIGRYTNEFDYGKGKQIMMRPYASNTSNSELEAMYEYLQSLK